MDVKQRLLEPCRGCGGGWATYVPGRTGVLTEAVLGGHLDFWARALLMHNSWDQEPGLPLAPHPACLAWGHHGQASPAVLWTTLCSGTAQLHRSVLLKGIPQPPAPAIPRDLAAGCWACKMPPCLLV